MAHKKTITTSTSPVLCKTYTTANTDATFSNVLQSFKFHS